MSKASRNSGVVVNFAMSGQKAPDEQTRISMANEVSNATGSDTNAVISARDFVKNRVQLGRKTYVVSTIINDNHFEMDNVLTIDNKVRRWFNKSGAILDRNYELERVTFSAADTVKGARDNLVEFDGPLGNEGFAIIYGWDRRLTDEQVSALRNGYESRDLTNSPALRRIIDPGRVEDIASRTWLPRGQTGIRRSASATVVEIHTDVVDMTSEEVRLLNQAIDDAVEDLAPRSDSKYLGVT